MKLVYSCFLHGDHEQEECPSCRKTPPDTQALISWMLEDGDRTASIVADAYSSWDTDLPWVNCLLAEIRHQKPKPASLPGAPHD